MLYSGPERMLKVTEIPSEDIGSALERMVHAVREDEDPDELKVYRALFKKHVPFNLRGYLVAYMIKALVARESTSPAARAPAPRTSAPRTSVPRTPAPRTAAPPTPGPRPQERRAEAPRRRRREAEPAPAANGLRRLFVSVGRNRRVRPEDLTSLISASVPVERSEFGAIRILDSYSFIEVPEGVAEETIAALSGTSFKGRRITVDFARSKS